MLRAATIAFGLLTYHFSHEALEKRLDHRIASQSANLRPISWREASKRWPRRSSDAKPASGLTAWTKFFSDRTGRTLRDAWTPRFLNRVSMSCYHCAAPAAHFTELRRRSSPACLKVRYCSSQPIAADRRNRQRDAGHLRDRLWRYAARGVRLRLVARLRRPPPARTHVRVAVDRTTESSILTFEDKRPGVSPIDREHMTKRFVRLNASRSTPG